MAETDGFTHLFSLSIAKSNGMACLAPYFKCWMSIGSLLADGCLVGNVSVMRNRASMPLWHDLCSIKNKLGTEAEPHYAAKNFQLLPN